MPLHQVFLSYGTGEFLRYFGFLLTLVINIMAMTMGRKCSCCYCFCCQAMGVSYEAIFFRCSVFFWQPPLLFFPPLYGFSFSFPQAIVCKNTCSFKFFLFFNQPQIYLYNLSLNVIQIAHEIRPRRSGSKPAFKVKLEAHLVIFSFATFVIFFSFFFPYP